MQMHVTIVFHLGATQRLLPISRQYDEPVDAGRRQTLGPLDPIMTARRAVRHFHPLGHGRPGFLVQLHVAQRQDIHILDHHAVGTVVLGLQAERPRLDA